MQKKLILHWDINGTITAVDTTEPGTAFENANLVIAKSVYGEDRNGTWVYTPHQRDQSEQSEHTITYYEWLKRHHHHQYKAKSFTFTLPGEPGESFRPTADELEKMCQGVTSDGKIALFESFYRTVKAFPDALHVFRTFGLDSDEVLKTLAKHPDPDIADKFQNVTRATIFGAQSDWISYEDPTSDQPPQVERLSDLPKRLASQPLRSNICVQENYRWWSRHNRDRKAGKQLVPCSNTAQLFFDDNDCVNIVYNIETENSRTGFYRVNTLQAVTDPDYYMKAIRSFYGNK